MSGNGAISPLARPGAVHLTVADLERSLAFYRTAIGLSVLERGDGLARLGAGDRVLLELVEQPGAQPSRGFTGLYHVAYLVPERRALATWLAHAARDRVPLVGLADHHVSEAIYLDDPDGHGIEIYADRPRTTWEGQVGSTLTTLPLDVGDLLGTLEDPGATPFDLLPDDTVIGHIHLKVAALPDTIAFYRDGLGLELMAQLRNQAAFMSAGGYHHHIGANTWESRGAGPAPAGSASLQHFELLLPDQAELDRATVGLERGGSRVVDVGDARVVMDPSGISLHLAIAA